MRTSVIFNAVGQVGVVFAQNRINGVHIIEVFGIEVREHVNGIRGQTSFIRRIVLLHFLKDLNAVFKRRECRISRFFVQRPVHFNNITIRIRNNSYGGTANRGKIVHITGIVGIIFASKIQRRGEPFRVFLKRGHARQVIVQLQKHVGFHRNFKLLLGQPHYVSQVAGSQHPLQFLGAIRNDFNYQTMLGKVRAIAAGQFAAARHRVTREIGDFDGLISRGKAYAAQQRCKNQHQGKDLLHGITSYKIEFSIFSPIPRTSDQIGSHNKVTRSPFYCANHHALHIVALDEGVHENDRQNGHDGHRISHCGR